MYSQTNTTRIIETRLMYMTEDRLGFCEICTGMNEQTEATFTDDGSILLILSWIENGHCKFCKL